MKNIIKKNINILMIILSVSSIGMFIGFAFVPCTYALIIPAITSVIAIAWFSYNYALKIKKNKSVKKLVNII